MNILSVTRNGRHRTPLADHHDVIQRLREGINERVVGRDHDGVRNSDEDEVPGSSTVDLMLGTLLAGGHILFSDHPGSGKTMLAQVLAAVIEHDLDDDLFAKFKSIPCCPDLLPMDIVGQQTLTLDDKGNNTLKFQPGPLFARIQLVDEINRLNSKTSAVFFEVLAQRQITYGTETVSLEPFHFVCATRNPHDEGTSAMSVALLDRFLIDRSLPQLSEADVARIMFTEDRQPQISPSVTLSELVSVQRALHLRGYETEEKRRLAALVNALQATIDEQVYQPGKKGWLKFGGCLSLRTIKRLAQLLRSIAFLRSEGIESRFKVTPGLLLCVGPDFLRHRLSPVEELPAVELTRRYMCLCDEAYEKCRKMTGHVSG